jgi:hypothetical protein
VKEKFSVNIIVKEWSTVTGTSMVMSTVVG